MTEETAEDRERRHLVPVARLDLPGQPDVIHLSVYQWLPAFQAWATGMAICGYSTRQGALPNATVTCPECLEYRPRYERMLAPGYRPEDDDPDVLRKRLADMECERDRLRVRLTAVTDETIARVVGPNIELLCDANGRLTDERDRARRWAVSLENENRRLTDQVREAKEHARVAMVAALNLQRQTPEAAQRTLGRIREARTWGAVWVELGQYFGLTAEQAGVEARSRRLGDSL
ncbi:hypothetical protein AB0G98_21565 [Streptomyces sp. NPDC020196]|uniref:hypothetical protein n=1 Tax=Streptomyces sp. NPDC020196 TaxID=3156656 RepID=UPI0033E1F4B8